MMSDADFEKWESLSKDPEFLQELELHQLANQLVVEFEALDIKAQTQEVIKQKSKSVNIKKILIASTAVVVTLIGGYLGLTKVETKRKTISHVENVDSLLNHTASEFINEQKDISVIKKKEVEIKRTENQIQGKKLDSVLVKPSVEKLNFEDTKSKDTILESLSMSVVKIEEKQIVKPCGEIKFEISTSATCESKNEGTIFVSKNLIKGGENPYLISIDNTNFIDDNLFSNLAKGEYIVSVKDKNGCISSLNTKIDVKSCKSASSKIALNPRNGEVWEYDNEEFYQATLKITAKDGKSVYESQILDYNKMWDGKDKFGKLLIPGLYFYTIEKDNDLKQRGELYIID